MLKKSLRLTTKEVLAVLEKGRPLYSTHFTVRVLKNEGANDSKNAGAKMRVSAITPSKVIKTAAARNSMRRKIYAAVEPIIKENNIKESSQNFNILVFAKTKATTATAKEMTADLKKLMSVL